MKIHPHHNVITAYLEGKIVEFYNGNWIAIPRISSSTSFPLFNPTTKYRIKEDNKKFRKKLKLVGNDVVIRDSEHWETDNVEIEFEAYTNKLIAVRIIV